MTGTALQTADAVDTWREVIALLAEAADRGYQEAITNPAAHSTALAADGLASAAIALLPEDLDHELDEVALDAVDAWLDAEFEGGRHAGRVAKLDALDPETA